MSKLQKLNMILSALSALYPKTSNTLKLIGLLFLTKKLLSFLSSLYKLFLRRRRNFLKRYGRNTWALVTGSSDGIGKGIALSLGKQGFNLILSARTQFKLDQARLQILRICPNIQIRTLVVNYQRSDQPSYLQSHLQQIRELDVSILVNNVGVDVLESYHKLPLEQIGNLMKVNCCSVTTMNRLFIPKFLQRKVRTGTRSAIVNVASLAGEIPMPLHNVYSASKSFVDCLSRALSYEYSSSIDILSLNPSQVCTPMTFHKKDIFTISPQACAEGMLDQLGHQRQTNGHWSHQIQGGLYRAVPEGVFNWIWMGVIAPEFMEERRKAMGRINAAPMQ